MSWESFCERYNDSVRLSIRHLKLKGKRCPIDNGLLESIGHSENYDSHKKAGNIYLVCEECFGLYKAMFTNVEAESIERISSFNESNLISLLEKRDIENPANDVIIKLLKKQNVSDGRILELYRRYL